MYEKILISSQLKILTGLHIGGSSVFSSIGAVDAPVVVDKKTQRPIIPGSSLKGKLRTLLVRSFAKNLSDIGQPNKDREPIRRLFGSSGTKDNKIEKARLQFADSYISPCSLEELQSIGFTEIKFENTIDRTNSVANPRQIERVISGVRFDVRIVYDLTDKTQLKEDMENIARSMKLLQLDYLGGHGTRGSGRVSFENIHLKPLTSGDLVSESEFADLQNLFKEVESYELLSI